MEFKVGDKVKCIEDSFSGGDLCVNEIYTVASSDGHCCQLEHTEKHQWNMSRFELVQPKQPSQSLGKNQFSPKPGDKIICNNGEEFVCCTLEFLRETVSLGIRSDKSIFGCSEKHDDWQDWDEDAFSSQKEYGIKEIIPAQQEVKQEVTEVMKTTMQEKTYTLEQIKEAFDALQWYDGSFELLSDKLKETQDPEYKLYLELKAKFEGKE